jgi:molybdopterin-guanine dinucleotide biosynthesis protein A
MIEAANITGVVLCGGEGLRMAGRDKPLEPVAGAPMVVHVVDRLAPQVGRVLISCNRSVRLYSQWCDETIVDEVVGRGPRKHTRGVGTDTHAVRVHLSGDAPLLSPSIVALLSASMSDDAVDACVPHDGTRTQHLFLLLRTTLRESLRRYLATGAKSVHGWLATVDVGIDAAREKESFVNINSAEAAGCSRGTGTPRFRDRVAPSAIPRVHRTRCIAHGNRWWTASPKPDGVRIHDGLSEEERADGFRALTRALANQLGRLEVDDTKPELAPFNLWRQKFYMDNPDCLYWVAEIAPGGRYRIEGNARSATFTSINAYAGSSLEARTVARVTSDELERDPDGRFSLLLGGEGGDTSDQWVAIPPDANLVWVRQFYDDPRAMDGSCSISRLDAVPPPPLIEVARFAKRRNHRGDDRAVVKVLARRARQSELPNAIREWSEMQGGAVYTGRHSLPARRVAASRRSGARHRRCAYPLAVAYCCTAAS